ncbi:peptide-methionine (S)-S-oxide reductase MsrA [Aliivibrio sp. S3MY1]|uniref:peptide-methionine (S)-S-oxide reductase MsrA n=1 Tax=unclassified Aliivibrio TaxID=2645654 RepID=UPI002379EE50|nr:MULTISPECIES: peptide-methionine (S)-S-oxide reductase MsrA [unclassified Aliivibrio]MDD9196352.1 peptide-methionine (S)-S-oxide reductase MsrA [Aliivibrio sp. S3MY1]MDD9199656.1 peptide-methionine (S)-S-oxide reductase MsrA [Aliivibrio sp. S2MY1]
MTMNKKNTLSPHFLSHVDLETVPLNHEVIYIGMGCFWGAERLFWQLSGVYSTAVGYTGGEQSNPNYKEVCTGTTNHAEVVKIVFDPTLISLEMLLHSFWQNHNPTQGMRQGNDIGTQYRSVIYTHSNQQLQIAKKTQQQYQEALDKQGITDPITTEIMPATPFYFAEDYHQQYLAKNPNGYCGLGGTGVCFL